MFNFNKVILIAIIGILINSCICVKKEDSKKVSTEIEEANIVNDSEKSSETEAQKHIRKERKHLRKEEISLNDKRNWKLINNAKYDKTESYYKTGGSIKLAKSGRDWNYSDSMIFDEPLEVEPGKSYILTLRFKTNSDLYPTVYVTGDLLNKFRRISKTVGRRYVNSQVNKWDKISYIFNVPNNKIINHFRPRIFILPKTNEHGEVWLDDFYFEEMRELVVSKISSKKSFDGLRTRVDSLGNMEIKKGGRWQPFFPFAIYADNARKDWKIYSKQGFNINMWASSATAVERGKKAGLMSGLQLTQYIMSSDWVPKNKKDQYKHLEKTIKKIKSSGLMDNVLFYYIDNEFYNLTEHLKNITDLVKKLDKGRAVARQRPIYMLNGAAGITRKYNNISDITGTYVAQDRANIPTTEKFTTLVTTENQTQPAVFAQINRGVGKNFRPILFGAIAKGAKGMGFWRDGGSGIDVEKAEWWHDFPNIVSEIKQMMPLIREPHFTDWSVECDNSKLIYGSRMYQNIGYLIIGNPTDKNINADFKISGLPYYIESVTDYFNNRKVGTISNNVIHLAIKPHGSLVVKLSSK